jgi:hypothetical protein
MILYKMPLVLCFVVLGLFLSGRKIFAEEADKPILFVKEGCSHCAQVEDFLSKNNLTDKFRIVDTILPENANLYNQMCDNADIKVQDRSVPLLFEMNGEGYFKGDQPIILHLEEKYSIPHEEKSQTKVLIVIIVILVAVTLSPFAYINLKKKS